MKVVWVNPKIELQSGAEGLTSDMASVRYRAIIPAKALEARGHQALVAGLDKGSIDHVRDQIGGADCIVFRKNYYEPACAEILLQEVRHRGIRTFFDISDDRFLTRDGPHLRRMIAQAGDVVTSSPALQQIVKEQTGRDARIVSDPYEGQKREAKWSPDRGRLKALWFGHESNLPGLQEALPLLLRAGQTHPLDLRIVTRRVPGIERTCKDFNAKNRRAVSLRFAEWSPAETWKSIESSDLIIIPSLPDENWARAKSPNRMIESLWAGRMVVANPVPAYLEFKDWAWVGKDLAEGIGWSIESGASNENRIRSAQDHIAAVYSPDRIAADWEHVLDLA